MVVYNISFCNKKIVFHHKFVYNHRLASNGLQCDPMRMTKKDTKPLTVQRAQVLKVRNTNNMIKIYSEFMFTEQKQINPDFSSENLSLFIPKVLSFFREFHILRLQIDLVIKTLRLPIIFELGQTQASRSNQLLVRRSKTI